MPHTDLPVTAMFNELIRNGRITPAVHMEEKRPPGEFRVVPSVLSYRTPDMASCYTEKKDAKLG